MMNLPTDSIDAVVSVRRHLEEALDRERVAIDAAAEVPELNQQLKLKRVELAAVQNELGALNCQLAAYDPTGGHRGGV